MISNKFFGTTKRGEAVTEFCLANDAGMSVTILDYGCTITKISVPDKAGRVFDVTLGYDTLAEYEESNAYFGAVVGRVANRIAGAQFELGGAVYKLAKNNGNNHLHGGDRGFDKFVWASEAGGDKLIFTRTSPDGEENYPGTLNVRVTYGLTQDNRLTIEYEAVSDEDTVLNLTNHAYFNLNGHASGDILGHRLRINAENYTESTAELLTTGKIIPAAGTPFDFTTEKAIGRDITMDDIQLQFAGGYDHNWVLSGNDSAAAVLYSPDSGIEMAVFTSMPGIQVYTSNTLSPRGGKGSAKYSRHSAICLETQFFPNAVNHKHFPSPVLKKGEKFSHTTEYCFGIR